MKELCSLSGNCPLWLSLVRTSIFSFTSRKPWHWSLLLKSAPKRLTNTFICFKYKCVNMHSELRIHQRCSLIQWHEKSNLVFLCLPVKIRLADPYLNCVVHRLDGSAEPANEILEQTSHERPLVAQTYSTAKGKNSASLALSTCLGVKSCVTCVCDWMCSSRLHWGSGSGGWSWCGGRCERPAPGRGKRAASADPGDGLRSPSPFHPASLTPQGRKQIMGLHFRGGAFLPPLALLWERGSKERAFCKQA